jgi:hypothetical protein
MADWKSVTLFSDVDADSVQFAFDDYQFVWVDGRTNNIARRVIINQDGEIVAASVGMLKPSQKPEFVGVKFSDQNDEGTGIGKGKVLLVCYTYVDDSEVESNPSPVAVIDSIQYMARGYYTKDGVNYFYPISGGTYTFDQNLIGSIESFVLNIAIDNEFVKRVNVYVAEADYVETIAPHSAFRLTTSRQITKGLTEASIAVAAVPSIVEVSYENDLAPKGDDIALVDGVAFIGNAVNSLGISQVAEKIWSITLTNQNKFNYANRWMRLDLFDEAGAYPVGADVLDGLADWSAEDLSLFRMLDSDLTTPLELLYYPLDSIVKTHKDIDVDDGVATRALLTVGSGLSGFTVTAKQYGTGGNSLTLMMEQGATDGRVACDPANNDYIKLTTEDGVYHVTVEVVNPEGAGALSIVCTLSDVYKYAIVITLEHDGANPVSKVGDIYTAIDAAMASGQELDGIIISAQKISDTTFNDDYIIPDSIAAYSFYRLQTYASASGNHVEVDLAYSTATDAIIARAIDVIAAIYSSPLSSALVSAIATNPPGIGIVSTLTQTALAGGTGTPTANGTDKIQTRMLSWIRVPQIMAFSEKTIYLVKFNSEPTTMSSEFIELITSGTPTATQLLITDFYKDYIQENPIADENTLIAERPNVPSLLNLGDDENGYSNGNAANQMLTLHKNNTPTMKYSYADTHTFDELCKYDVVAAKYASEQWGCGVDAPMDLATSGVNFSTSGYIWIRYSLRSLPSLYDRVIMGISTYDDPYASFPSSDRPFYIYLDMNNELLKIFYYDDDSGVEQASPAALSFSDITWTDYDQMGIIVAWEQSIIYGAGLTLKIGMLLNGEFRTATLDLNVTIDASKDMAMLYITHTPSANTNQVYPTLFGLRKNQTIDDDWQMLNILRFLPLYPTEGIGVYNEFALNTSDTISFVNQNVLIETMNQREDNRPGRIQWGNYGAMPDLNEYSINEDIMGIVPIKSFQPTDEHNTILVFTKNNTAVLALLGDTAQTCTVTRQLNGIGLVNRNALCVLHDGVAWLSQQGVMIITASGIVNISKGIMDTSDITKLIYDYERNWIWARGLDGSTQVTFVYQVEQKLWWSYAGAVHPDDFVGCISDETGWISYVDTVMYKDSSTAHTTTAYLTLIKTRAVAMVKKLGRINLIGTLTSGTYKLKARMFSNKITGISTETAEFTETMNSPTSIPGVGADYVQLDLKQVNNIVAVAIEYENGVR